MRTREIMTGPALTCGADDTLGRAAQLMWENDCGVVPIVEQSGRLVGMVTDRDICMATYTQNKAPGQIPVNTVMTREVVSCHLDDTIEKAERLMKDRQVRRIPIVDDNEQPLGVLSLNDIARSAASGGITQRDLAETLAAIGAHRARAAASAE